MAENPFQSLTCSTDSSQTIQSPSRWWIPLALFAASPVDNLECSVCGAAIRFPHTLKSDQKEFPVCKEWDCRIVARQRSSMAPANFLHHLKFRRKIICDKRDREAARKNRVAALKENESRENLEILRQALNQNPALSEEDIDLLVIPSGHSAIGTLPDDRIRDYTEHLKKTISEAAAHADASLAQADEKARQQLRETELRFSADPKLRTISDQLCGMCKGGCCTAGGDTAYITVDTIRRFMDEHPDLSAEQILNIYVSRVSSETVTSACINQTKAGCALPREMRSDTCNGYYCDALQSWHERPIEERSSTVLAIRRCNSNWRRFDLDSLNAVVDVAMVRSNEIVPLSIKLEPSELES